MDHRRGSGEPVLGDQVRVQIDPAGRPSVAVGGASQGFVLGGEDTEVLGVALCPLEGLVRGKVGGRVGEHTGEHLARALR